MSGERTEPEKVAVETAFRVTATGRTAYLDLDPVQLPRLGETVALSELPWARGTQYTVTDVYRQYAYEEDRLVLVVVELKEK